MNLIKLCIPVLFFAMIMPQTAFASDPVTIFHQGYLTDETGEPVEDGTYIFTFHIYDAETGDSSLWTENQILQVNGGVFNAHLGEEELLDLPFDEKYWIGIAIDGGDELKPRMPMSAVPYAMHALSVKDGVITGAKLDPEVLQAGDNISVELDENNNFVISADTPESGLTSVTTNETLEGDGTEDAPLGILIPEGFISSTELADDAVTTDKLSDEAVTQQKLHPDVSLPLSGEAGGDLTGTYPDPEIADGAVTASKLDDMSAEAGEVLQWDGSVWAPGVAGESVWSGTGSDIFYNEGNVGIGTDDPGQALDVHGNIEVSGWMGTAEEEPVELRVNDEAVLRIKPAFLGNSFFPNLVAGATTNEIIEDTTMGVTISGGSDHIVDGNFSTIGGGNENTAEGSSSTVGGGQSNTASGGNSTVGGGFNNTTDGGRSTIGGGGNNTVSGFTSTIGGGALNTASGNHATVPGGLLNEASGNYSFAAGKDAKAEHSGTFVWADDTDLDFISTNNQQFLIRAGGGVGINTNDPAQALDVHGNIEVSGWIGTAEAEPVELRVNDEAVLRIEPAFADNIFRPNIVAGAPTNEIDGDPINATISGGEGNTASGSGGTVGGGTGNTVSNLASTVGGGQSNSATGDRSTVGGGQSNSATGDRSTVGGGTGNTVSSLASTVGGGQSNSAIGDRSIVGGGLDNTASGSLSSVGGGGGNTASGNSATVPGGVLNAASGDYSFAAGRRAKAEHDGTFVWADDTGADFSSTGAQQFLIRAGGGVGINTNSPGRGLHIKQRSTDANEIGLRIEQSGTSTNNWAMYVAVSDNLGFRYNDQLMSRINSSDGEFVALSDRRFKASITPLDGVLDKVLQLEPSSYLMNVSESESSRTFGLIAQDVKQHFPEAVSKQEGTYGISYSNITVLNTAALIELNRKYEAILHAQEDRIATLESENADLKLRLSAIEEVVGKFTSAAEVRK